MRFLAFLIIASVILCIARALTLVLILVLGVSIVWAIITRPLDLIGFIFLMVLSQMISASPLATIIAITCIVALVVLRQPKSADGASPMSDVPATRH